MLLARIAGVVVGVAAVSSFGQTTRPAAVADPVTFQVSVDPVLAPPAAAVPVSTTPTVDPSLSNFTWGESGLQMQVPNDWDGYFDATEDAVKFYGPAQGAKVTPCFTVSVTELGSADAPDLEDPSGFNAYKDLVVGKLGEANTGWFSALIDRAVVDGSHALRVIGTTTVDGRTGVKAMNLRLVRDRRLYVFEFVASADRFDYLYLTAKRIVRSVKFAKPGVGTQTAPAGTVVSQANQ